MGFQDQNLSQAALTQSKGNLVAAIQILLKKYEKQNLNVPKPNCSNTSIPLASIFTQDIRQSGSFVKHKKMKLDKSALPKRRVHLLGCAGSSDQTWKKQPFSSCTTMLDRSCPGSEACESLDTLPLTKQKNSTLSASETTSADVVDLDFAPNPATPDSKAEHCDFIPQSVERTPEGCVETLSDSLKCNKRKYPIQRAPLAERMRPSVWDNFIGQPKIRDIVKNFSTQGIISSIILWGPPGCGKTTVGKIIGGASGCFFVTLSAESCGISEIKQVITRSKNQFSKTRTLLFFDEIHRLNKLQQDVFLPAVESGDVTLIGATTENPSFSINKALLSRCQVLCLEKLTTPQIRSVLERAVHDHTNGVRASFKSGDHEDGSLFDGSNSLKKNYDICIEDRVFDSLATLADGDARVALNALEVAVLLAFKSLPTAHSTPCDTPPEACRVLGCRAGIRNVDEQSTDNSLSNASISSCQTIKVTLEHARKALQRSHIHYDANGDEHYNHISALHKSIRGSDVQASIYWLARMLEGGEDPVYVARRLVRAACEDVGMEDPMALQQATCTLSACQTIGMPECSVVLTQCVIYLASAPKSRAVDEAYAAAKECVKRQPHYPVPLHLRNAPTKLLRDLGWGPDKADIDASFLPDPLRDRVFYKHTDNRPSSPAF